MHTNMLYAIRTFKFCTMYICIHMLHSVPVRLKSTYECDLKHKTMCFYFYLFIFVRLFAFFFANILFARSVTWCYRQWQWHRHSNGSMSSRDRNYYPVNTPNVHHSNVKINKIVEYSLFCSTWAYASVHYGECEHTCTCLPIEIEQYVVLTFDQN